MTRRSTPLVGNFSAGPGVLPEPVIAEIREDLPLFGHTGASILEISHRTPPFEAVIEEAEANLRDLLGVGPGYRVLFLQGGASLQFAMIPYNFLGGGTADYVVAGTWGKKAAEDARKAGTVNVAWDGAPHRFTRMPAASEYQLTPGAAYLHVTSNETIEGVQVRDQGYPDTGDVPLVCDASSDILSRPLDVSRYGLLYAGAQKNAGAAGVTLVFLSESLLARAPKDRFAMLSYPVQAASKSLYNTPPCFAVYVVLLVSRWLRDTVGGLAAMERQNHAKAARLYAAIDGSSGFYRAHAELDSRSLMNVTFRLPSAALEERFCAEAEANGMIGLRGHRAFGGVRASLYNALPMRSVEALVAFMAEFQRHAG